MLVIINIFILKLEKLRLGEVDCLCKAIHACEAAGPGLDSDYKSHVMSPLARQHWACVRSLHLHSSVQSPSCVQLFVTPWTAARQAALSIADAQRLLKPMSIDSMMPPSHLNIDSFYFTISQIIHFHKGSQCEF